MNLAKSSLYTSFFSIVRIGSVFIISKAVAVYAGPSGVGLIGQLQSFISIVLVFSTGAVEQGVIKYLAEYKEDSKLISEYLINALYISSLFCAISSLILIAFSTEISKFILLDSSYYYLFIVFGITIFFYVLKVFIFSAINGLGKIKSYALINSIGSVIILVNTVTLSVLQGLSGALLALVINQSLVFIFASIYFYKTFSSLFNFRCSIDIAKIKQLFKYSIMGIVSILMSQLVHIILRKYIAFKFSWDEVGYWQSVWKISETYLLIITSILGVYLLPKFSSLRSGKQIKSEIYNGYKFILPIVLLLTTLIYFFRLEIILVLFTDQFIKSISLFQYQLIGDVFKICSWIPSFLLIAKTYTKIFIFTEILFSTSFLLLAIYFSSIFGLVGLTYAYSLNYFLYLMTITIILRNKLNYD